MKQSKSLLTVMTTRTFMHESFDKEQLDAIIPYGINNKLHDADMENAAKFLLMYSLENEYWSAISSKDFLQVHNYCYDGWDAYVECYLRSPQKKVSSNPKFKIFPLLRDSIGFSEAYDAPHVSGIVKGMNDLIKQWYAFLIEIDGVEYISPSKKLLTTLGIELKRAPLIRS